MVWNDIEWVNIDDWLDLLGQIFFFESTSEKAGNPLGFKVLVVLRGIGRRNSHLQISRSGRDPENGVQIRAN